jgi:hypothetical protein
VVEPNCVLNDQCGKAVAVGLDVRHGWSAYPEPVKATQPQQVLLTRAVAGQERGEHSTEQQQQQQNEAETSGPMPPEPQPEP